MLNQLEDEQEFTVGADTTEREYKETERKYVEISRKLRNNFYMMPNKIFEWGLTPIAFTLYSYIRRVAGDEGACWQSTKRMSEKLNISMGAISNAKRELVTAGLIVIEERPTPNGGRPYHRITIVDIWDAEPPNSCSEQPNSCGELSTSSGELKKTPVTETPVNKTPLHLAQPEKQGCARAEYEKTIESEFPEPNKEPRPPRTAESTRQGVLNAISNWAKSTGEIPADSENFISEIPENIRELARVFVGLFGRVPVSKSERRYWILEWNNQYVMGLRPESIKAAFSRMKSENLTIKSPESVTAIAWSEQSRNGGDPYHGAHEVWDSNGRIR